MNQVEFNKSLTKWNAEYKELFGTIPCIKDFSCSREEYMSALQRAVKEKKRVGEYLAERE